uniref:LysR substrate-binding domain-containing protein n=1 Tax=Herbaspirillum seropedicae TaxID=964 RepID=UPI0031DC0097
TSVRQHLDAVLRPGGVIHTGLEVEHLATVAALIESGLGVSVVPELTLFQFRLPNLVAIPLDAPELKRPLLIVTPKERSLSVAAQGLLELVEGKAKAETETETEAAVAGKRQESGRRASSPKTKEKAPRQGAGRGRS